MLTSIKYSNFKGLENFTIYLKDFNILTGPNNNGKSTILDGLRLLQGAYRSASRSKPKFISNPFGKSYWGFYIPENSLPLNLGYLQTNFNQDEPSLIKFSFAGGKSLTLSIHPEHKPVLYFDTETIIPKTASDFRKEFPLQMAIVPTLGPLETEEDLLDEGYVKQTYGSRRSPRMFRSYWYYNLEKFEKLQALVKATWPGMDIRPPYKENFDKRLVMFCEEERMPREICWAGFGFQIWLQLLTHIVNSENANVIVVDEPEIYLHPDLQHKVLDLLKTSKATVIIATHSVEIINSVEPSEVLLIDKKSKQAKRITDLVGLQRVSNILGSGQNIELTRLARGKKILFVEGKDIKLLTRLAKVLKKDHIFSDTTITVIPIEGFSQHDRIIHTNWAFTKVLGEELKIAVLLDRDYRSDEDISTISEKLQKEISFAHILKRKELENYFLAPDLLSKVIQHRLDDRTKTSFGPTITLNVTELLIELTDKFKSNIFGQLIAQRTAPYQKKGLDLSTIISQFNSQFEISWKNLYYRLNVVPGKQFVSELNEYLQEHFKISITYTQIANYMSSEHIDSDLEIFFSELEKFKIC